MRGENQLCATPVDFGAMEQSNQFSYQKCVQTGIQFIDDQRQPLVENIEDRRCKEYQDTSTTGLVIEIEDSFPLLSDMGET